MTTLLHKHRPSHAAAMLAADHYVGRALEFKTKALHAPDPGKETGEAALWMIAGWEQMRGAITAVVKCGCPPELWPERVRENIRST